MKTNLLGKSLLIVLSLVAVTALVVIGAEQQSALAGTAAQNYSVGFSDGCNGVPISGHHTSDYLAGHAAGEAKCQNTGQKQSQDQRQSVCVQCVIKP